MEVEDINKSFEKQTTVVKKSHDDMFSKFQKNSGNIESCITNQCDNIIESKHRLKKTTRKR